MNITITGVLEDHGSIVELEGITDDGVIVAVACDHRPAQDIVNALEQEGAVEISGWEPWQVRVLA